MFNFIQWINNCIKYCLIELYNKMNEENREKEKKRINKINEGTKK